MLATQRMLNTELVIASLGLIVQAALLAFLIRRHWQDEFPFFVLYVGFALLTVALGLWAMLSSSGAYFSFYWITEAISGILELLVLREAFMSSMWMEYQQRPGLRGLPPAILLIIGGTALWRGVYRPFGPGWFEHLGAGAYAFELGANLLEIVIFVFSLRLVRREFHPMRNLHRFSIVAGLGLIACASLLPDLVRLKAYNSNSHTAAALDALLRHLPPAAYVGVLVIWLMVFLRPLPAKTPATVDEIEHRLRRQRKIQRQIKNLVIGKATAVRALKRDLAAISPDNNDVNGTVLN